MVEVGLVHFGRASTACWKSGFDLEFEVFGEIKKVGTARDPPDRRGGKCGDAREVSINRRSVLLREEENIISWRGYEVGRVLLYPATREKRENS